MSPENSRMYIPDDWALKVRCPVCGGAPLKIFRQDGKPDQMSCERCRCAFELEESSNRIWFKSLAPVLVAVLSERWLTVNEVGEAVRVIKLRRASQVPTHVVSVPPPPIPDAIHEQPNRDGVGDDVITSELDERLNSIPMPAPATPRVNTALESPPSPLTQTEVNRRVLELHKLGNTSEQIRDILLSGTSTTLQQVNNALISIEQGELQRRSHQSRTIYWILAGVVAFLFLCALIAYGLRSSLGSLISLATFVPGVGSISTEQPGQSLPQNVPTVIIKTGAGTGSAIVACPKNPEQAAQTFGGAPENWSTDPQNTSWYLLSPLPVTVRIPENMGGVIVSGAGADFNARTIDGPATVQNAVSIGINCK
jgi:hypothetical protein